MNPRHQVWYIAGPMSGLPGFNIPAFEAARNFLLSRGIAAPVCPFDNLTVEEYEAAKASPDGKSHGKPYLKCLVDDLKMVEELGVNVICLLPGWHKSRGARLEVHLALELKWRIFSFIGNSIWECRERQQVTTAIYTQLNEHILS